MDYQWDIAKERTNRRKHRVAFADAVSVLEDGAAITIQGEDPDEERFITIGMNALGHVLVVVYTFRGESVRILSARKAAPSERKEYEKWT